jgi:hypothetical protein
VPLHDAKESRSEMIDDAWPHEQGEAGAAGQPDTAPEPDDRPWLAWSVGDRVVVRYRIERTRDGGPGHTDALGYLASCTLDGVTVRTRTGDVVIPAEAIAVGKRVPPPPPRRRSDS